MYKIDQLENIEIGVVGENEAKIIEIDVRPWLAKWPDASFGITAMRPGEETAYPCQSELENGILKWIVTGGDVAISGRGKMDVRAYQGTLVAKTPVIMTIIEPTMPGNETEIPPDAEPGWLDALSQSTAEAQKAADEARAAIKEIDESTVKGYADYAKETAEYIKEMVDGFESTADGDMRKSTYDKDKNGVVDNSERLGGELPEAYRKKADKIALADVENALAKDWLTGTFPASGWAENGGNWVQTIAADLNTETDDVQIDVALPTGEGKQEALDAWSNLYDFEMGNQTLTAKWFEKPEVDITVKILRWREVK